MRMTSSGQSLIILRRTDARRVGWTKRRLGNGRGSARWRTSRWIARGMRRVARPSHATGLRQIIIEKGRTAAAYLIRS